MRHRFFLYLVLLTSLGQALAKAERPNVLFIAVDDMKDWVNCLGGYEGRVHTPNIDRLPSAACCSQTRTVCHPSARRPARRS